MTIGPHRVPDDHHAGQQHVRRVAGVRHPQERQIQALDSVTQVPLRRRLQLDPEVIDHQSGTDSLGQALTRVAEDVRAGCYHAWRDKEPCSSHRMSPSEDWDLQGDRRRPQQVLTARLGLGHGVGLAHSNPTFRADLEVTLPITAMNDPDSKANSQPNSTETFDASVSWSMPTTSLANSATPPITFSSLGP